MVLRLLSTLIKIVLASLVVGIILAYLDISPEEVLKEVGMTQAELMDYLSRALVWAVPHILLGTVVTVPVWIVIHLFRPPRS